MNQTTIKSDCLINRGVGLHSGKEVPIHFSPAGPDHGIVFHRLDKGIRIPAIYNFAKPSPLCTTIQKDGTSIATIEHLLSVCNGMGIDNLLVELKGEEIPIFDGSGYEFYQQLDQVGIKELPVAKKAIRIIEPISFEKGDIRIIATPAKESVFTFSIEYEHQQIGAQEVTFVLNTKNYIDQIVRAKTFCLEEDVQKMKKMGLIKGGSKKNAIVLNQEGQFDNLNVMTWLNEPNLHKILDQIGDFYLANNLRILGNIYSHKSGHAAHSEFLHYMFDECSDSFEIVEI